MEDRKRRAAPAGRRQGIGTGTVSLLVIFALLFFSTLALLSLTAAISNQKVTRRSLALVSGLSAAEGEMAGVLAQVDDALVALQQEYAAGPQQLEGYYKTAAAAAVQLGFEAEAKENSLVYTLEIDENHVLVTQILLLAPGGTARYAVTGQYTEVTGEWSPAQGGQLWGG
ncbi:MAG: hypothetical protein ACK5L3_05590 [Oscillospiraceae bacterium]